MTETETRLRRRGLLALLLALAGALVATSSPTAGFATPPDDDSVADVDGPYLFEAQGGGFTSKRIVKSEKGAAASIEKLS